MPSFIGILQHNITEFAQIDHENKLKQKNNGLFWIKFIAAKTTCVKYLIFSNSVQIWYDFQSHRTMRPQMQIFAHRAKQCAVCVLANNILTFWPLTLRLPPHQLHLWYLSFKKNHPSHSLIKTLHAHFNGSDLTIAHTGPVQPVFNQFKMLFCPRPAARPSQVEPNFPPCPCSSSFKRTFERRES